MLPIMLTNPGPTALRRPKKTMRPRRPIAPHLPLKKRHLKHPQTHPIHNAIPQIYLCYPSLSAVSWLLASCCRLLVTESTTTRTAGGLDFTAIGGKRKGREVPQSLKINHPAASGRGIEKNLITRWNRGFSCEAPGLENQIKILGMNRRFGNLGA